MWNEPIHVVGSGSIGLLWTASIRSRYPKFPITLLLRDSDRNRKRVASALKIGRLGSNNSLDISWNHNREFPKQKQRISLPVQFIRDARHNQDSIQTLVVATKAHQARNAVESILDRLLLPATNDDPNQDFALSPSTKQIIILCNGALSVREELNKLLVAHASVLSTTGSRVSVALATTTHGAYRSEPDTLVHAGYGTSFLESQLGAESSQTNSMVELWNRAGLNCTPLTSQQMNAMLWNKLAANCVINPLTSLFRCKNGELLQEPSFSNLKEQVLIEVASVAQTVARIDSSATVPTLEEMRAFVDQTIHDTQDNKSSMYQDVVEGNATQTEIEHLNGYVVRKGTELGVDCPESERLCSEIVALTTQNAARTL